MRHHLAFLVVVVAGVGFAGVRSVHAAREADQAIPWARVSEGERVTLTRLLESRDWPFRAFGLLRLERFSGPAVEAHLRRGVRDPAWQVRCFALRQAGRMGIAIAPEDLDGEVDPRVIRTALRHGVRLDSERITQQATTLMRTKALQELMLGLEIAAATDIEPIREEAVDRGLRLIKRMDDAVCALISRRLAVTLGVSQIPETGRAWRQWLAERGGKLILPRPTRRPARRLLESPSLVAEMDAETFARLLDYLEGLRQRDLDLVIVMDATASMLPMVNEARTGIDALILFLGDISGTMRLAFVAYRDHDNKPVWEGHPFTTEIKAIREFLFDLRITGGADYPEAVLEGVAACRKLDWNRRAAREIVVVGDAPPHEEDYEKLTGTLETFRSNGVVVHAVHVPMRRRDGYERYLTPAQLAADIQWLETYNRQTAEAFAQIARLGSGRMVTLTHRDQLVPSIMRFTIAEPWWPVFDEFYELYLELCR